nr:UDP-glycosyltransferase 85C1-like [Tanacetum cinerariifolium]
MEEVITLADAAYHANKVAPSSSRSAPVFMLLYSVPLLSALLAFAIAQFLKVITTWYKEKRWDPKKIVGSGGMPSSHSSTVMALAVSIGLHEGIDSSSFAIAVIMAFIVMYDATGVRLHAGRQAERLVKSGGTHWLEDHSGFQFKTVPDGLPSVTDEDVEHTQTVAELWTYIGNTFCDSFLDIVSSLELPVTCIICDGFMTYTNMIYTAEKLGVPIVLFWTMAACGFMGFYQAKVLTEKGLIPLKDESYLDVEIDWIPGMEGICLRDLPEFNIGFKYLLETALAADKWLKSKEQNTVLYVNFGSLAQMSLQHLLEFGWGLVNSNHTFLWIIRSNLVVDGTQQVLPRDLKEAVDKKGFIASWCSQEEVLNHPSVGGFLTHGGWGSIIESLSAGVPMICCPFSGDQRINCRQMCKDWEVGMEIERDVKRDQVEKLAKLLMEGAEGEKMRKKAVQWKKMAENATGPKGSSSLDTEKLADLIINF